MTPANISAIHRDQPVSGNGDGGAPLKPGTAGTAVAPVEDKVELKAVRPGRNVSFADIRANGSGDGAGAAARAHPLSRKTASHGDLEVLGATHAEVKVETGKELLTKPSDPAVPAAGKSMDSAGDLDSEADEDDPDESKHRFTLIIRITIATLGLAAVGAGIVLRLERSDDVALDLAVWRWCVFIGALYPLRILANFIVVTIVRTVEHAFFLSNRLVYFLSPLKPALTTLLQFAFYLALWAVLVTADGGFIFSDTGDYVLRGLICAVLYCVGRVLAGTLTKIFASRFNLRNFFDRLKQSLEKEYYLAALTVPRPKPKAHSRKSSHALGARGHRRFGSADAEDFRPVLPKSVVSASFSEGGRLGEGGVPSKAGKMKTLPEHDELAEGATNRGKGPAEQLGAGSIRGLRRLQRRSQPGVTSSSAMSSTPPPSVGPSQLSNTETSKMPPRAVSPSLTEQSEQEYGWRDVEAELEQQSRHTTRQPWADEDENTGTGSALDMKDILRRRSDVERHFEDFKDLDSEQVTEAQVSKLERYIRRNHFGVTFSHAMKQTRKAQDQKALDRMSRKLGRWLWTNVRADRTRKEIVPSDLQFFLPADQVRGCFELLDSKTKDGRVTRHDVLGVVKDIIQERGHLAKTMQDSNTIVGKMGSLIQIVINVILVPICLAVFRIDVENLWISLSAVFLAFGFVFGNTLKNIFESALLLFATHPFDVGDVIIIEGEWYIVKEISLLRTTVEHELCAISTFPNHVLNNLQMANLSRSGNKWDAFHVYIDVSTAAEVVDQLDRDVQAVVKAKPEYFPGGNRTRMYVPGGTGKGFKILVSVWFEMASNGVDLGWTGLIRNTMFKTCMESLTKSGVRVAHQHTMVPGAEVVAGPDHAGPQAGGASAAVGFAPGSVPS
ncbi:unnamed protein product [Pedinophyceae sp. YPF-701]|nr:unnamed protein product [Pedinophyceae sp. YPF-701]